MKLNNSKGTVLGMVLIISFISLFIVGVLIALLLNNARIAQKRIERIKAFYRAQAGMEYAIYHLYTGTAEWTPPAGGSVTHNDIAIGTVGTVDIVITDLPAGAISDCSISVTAPYQG